MSTCGFLGALFVLWGFSADCVSFVIIEIHHAIIFILMFIMVFIIALIVLFIMFCHSISRLSLTEVPGDIQATDNAFY